MKILLYILLLLAAFFFYMSYRFKKMIRENEKLYQVNVNNHVDVISEEAFVDGCLGKIYGVLQYPKGKEDMTLIIMSHGFGGSYEHNTAYGAYLAREGFGTYSFGFGGGSRGPSRSEGTMLEMSVLTEAEDLNAVIDHFKADGRFGRIILFGQSQGGFVSAYIAGKRNDDIEALSIEYPAFVIQDDAKKRMNEDGSFPETSSVLGAKISAKYNIDALSFDIYDVIGGFRKDVLIIHGDADQIVPLDYSKKADEVYENSRLVVLPGQGHGFRAEGLKRAMEEELDFFRKHS